MDIDKATLAARAHAREIKRKVLSWRDYFPAQGLRDGKTHPNNQDAQLRDETAFPSDLEKGSTRSERI